jgi:hypothetical protein
MVLKIDPIGVKNPPHSCISVFIGISSFIGRGELCRYPLRSALLAEVRWLLDLGEQRKTARVANRITERIQRSSSLIRQQSE